MSRLELEALRMFAEEIRSARRMKARLIEIAKEDPERILRNLEQLPEEDRETLRWLARLARRYLNG
jgi:hypothetical protein